MHDFIQHCAHSDPESPRFFNLIEAKEKINEIVEKENRYCEQ